MLDEDVLALLGELKNLNTQLAAISVELRALREKAQLAEISLELRELRMTLFYAISTAPAAPRALYQVG